MFYQKLLRCFREGRIFTYLTALGVHIMEIKLILAKLLAQIYRIVPNIRRVSFSNSAS